MRQTLQHAEAVRSFKHELRQGEIREAARQLMESLPFEEITMVDIAAAAQLSRATLYLYYSSKFEILRDIIDSGQHEVTEQLAVALRGARGFRERLLAVTSSLLEVLQQNRAVYQTVTGATFWEKLGPDGRATLLSITAHFSEFLESIIEQGITDGELESHDTKESRWALITSLYGALAPRIRVEDHDPSADELARRICDYFVRAYGDGQITRASQSTEL